MNTQSFLDILLIVGVAFLLIVLFATCICVAYSPTMDKVEWQEETYAVESGDTLWGIATKHCPKTVDYREWIKEVKEINGLADSKICKGDMLTVLVPKD